MDFPDVVPTIDVMPQRLRGRVGLAAGIALGLAVLGLLGIGRFHEGASAREAEEVARVERISTDLASARLSEAVSELRTTVLSLATRPIVQGTLSESDQRQVSLLFVDTMSRNPQLAQLRLIDDGGQERVRVERSAGGHPREVPPYQLQDKSDRYYVREGLSRAPGDIYLSPLDLNVEHGEVLRPFEPMIRAVAPVGSHHSCDLLGLIVANYRAGALISELAKVGHRERSKMEIVAADGSWIHHPEPNRAWGSMIPERANEGFAHVDPEGWSMLQARTHGQWLREGSLITTAVVAVDPRLGAVTQGPAGHPYAYFKAQVSPKDLTRDTDRLAVSLYVILVLALAGVGSFVVGLAVVADTKCAAAQELQSALQMSDHHAALATSASEARLRFLANMSHEIRTPMNGILGMADHLLDVPLEAEARAMVRVIRSSGMGLLAILNDILDFSKIDAGHLAVEHVPTDIVPVASECIELLAMKARTKGIVLSAELPAASLVARTDPNRLRQILLNLIGNAIKFTEKGSVRVRLTVDWVSKQRLITTWHVIDTGIGISQDRLETVFEVFAQAETSTARRFGGTGLGLAISRELAKLMGGTLTAQSVLGEGSCFCLRLPLEAAELPREATDVEPQQALGQRAILLVDDNRVNRMVGRRYLEREGIEAVDEAENGESAVEMARARAYDLIFMDIHMPQLDGLQATQLIRSHEKTDGRAAVPIVALTASALRSDADRCLEAGMTGFLSKPIEPAALRTLLYRTLFAPE